MKIISLLKITISILFAGISNSGWTFDDARHHFGDSYTGDRYGFGHGRFLLSPYYAFHPRVEKRTEQPPVVYIQRRNSKLSTTGIKQDYWHYCSNPKGYYPVVKNCSEGWLPVAPQPK